MKYYNIATKATFNLNGEEKVKWYNCGTMREMDDGKRFINFNHQPELTYYVFEKEDRQDKQWKEVTKEDSPF